MKYLDFTLQTTILLLTILLVAVSYGELDLPIGILVAQLALGSCQYLSSLISVLVDAPFLKQKKIHLVVSTIYLLLLYVGAQEHFHGISFPAEVILPALTIPAWTLGIYYYIITWRWAFPKIKRRGRFLPHLSF
jgi:hypothetical protein